MKHILPFLLLAVLSFTTGVLAQESKHGPAAQAAAPASGDMAIPAGAKIYIAEMPDTFDGYLKDALKNKKVPVEVVDSRDQADFEITGTSMSQKASTAKKVLFYDWRSTESASIKVENLKSGVIAFAYSYHASSSQHGKKSSAEACAKHLKSKIESGK